MKNKVLKEEIIWTLAIVLVVGAIVFYYPSREYWGERIWDRIINPGEPLEGNIIKVGNPPLFELKVPNYKEWEVGDISGSSLILRREHDKSPIRIEVTVEEDKEVDQPKTYRAFKAYANVIADQFKEEGYTVKKVKVIYIGQERWALIELKGWNDDRHISVYLHRSPTRLYKTVVEFPTSEEFEPRESHQYGRAVAYSLRVLDGVE